MRLLSYEHKPFRISYQLWIRDPTIINVVSEREEGFQLSVWTAMSNDRAVIWDGHEFIKCGS